MSADMNLMELCRLCLVKDGGKIPIFADGDPERIMKITTCLPVNILRHDCLPQTICNGCSFRLELSYQFWNTTLNAEEELIMLSKQINLKSVVDVEEATVTVMQIKNEPLDVSDRLIHACKQETVDIDDINTIVEMYADETSLEVNSKETTLKNSENDYNLNKLGSNLDSQFGETEVDLSGHTALQNQVALSTSSQTAERSKRKASIKATKVINSITKDNEENVDDSDTNEKFTVPTNQDAGRSEDFLENFDSNFISAGTNKNTKVEVVMKTGSKDKIVKRGLKFTEQILRSNRKHFMCKSSKRQLTQNGSLKKCTICKKEFSNAGSFARHMFLHTGDDPYKCSECQYKCFTSVMLKKHVCKHTGEKPYECNVCKYKCSQLGNLQRHVRKHTGEKPYNCNVCGYKCSISSYLKIHMRKHTGEKPYECHVCEYKSSQSSALKMHMYKHTGGMPHKCSVCGYNASQSSTLKEHMGKHIGEKPHKCTDCKYTCLKRNHLKVHMRQHTGEKPYQCSVCDYRCSQNSNLKKHMSKHLDEMPHNVCEYKASQSSTLKMHMYKHTGEKPLKCEYT